METDGVRSVYFCLAAVYQRVRARCTTERFYCNKAEAPVQRKCYENVVEQGRYYRTIGYDVEGSVRSFSRDVRHKRSTTIDMPAFNEIRSWTKDLSPLTHFIFMQLYHYLVSSKEKIFDKSRWRISNRSRHTSTLQMASLLMFAHKNCIEKIAA